MTDLALNRRARHRYFLEEEYEAGISLLGWEVKAIRAGRAQLKESYVVVRRGELFLLNCHIAPLATTRVDEANPRRSRKLLAHAREIKRLIGAVKEKGRALAPLDMHLRNGKIKLQFALARGKKTHDKRDSIQRREWQREQWRVLKTGVRKRGS